MSSQIIQNLKLCCGQIDLHHPSSDPPATSPLQPQEERRQFIREHWTQVLQALCKLKENRTLLLILLKEEKTSTSRSKQHCKEEKAIIVHKYTFEFWFWDRLQWHWIWCHGVRSSNTEYTFVPTEWFFCRPVCCIWRRLVSWNCNECSFWIQGNYDFTKQGVQVQDKFSNGPKSLKLCKKKIFLYFQLWNSAL